MGKRQWMWERQKLETVVSKKEVRWEKNVFVYLSSKGTESQKENERQEQAMWQKHLLPMAYTERCLSADRTRNIFQPTNHSSVCVWVWLCTFSGLCKYKVRNSQERRKRVLVMNFSASAWSHPLARKKWAPVLEVLVVTTRPVTRAKLSTVPRQGFHNGLQSTGEQVKKVYH